MKKLYFLGPVGSYSQIIASHVFPNTDRLSCNSFADIVRNIKCNRSSIGVLPIENSITSNIHENMDFLFNNSIKIISEANLHIILNCIGLKGTDIKKITQVYSHYKALEQCNKFIKLHKLIKNNTGSTAEAANVILSLSDKNNVLIGSRELIKNQKLKILKDNIGDVKHNITRFVFITHEKSKIESHIKNKLSVVCTIAHRPGTLARLLNSLAKLGVNLTKIESRPIPGTDWEYQFWIDIELNPTIHKIDTVLKTIKSETMRLLIKGMYEIGKQYES